MQAVPDSFIPTGVTEVEERLYAAERTWVGLSREVWRGIISESYVQHSTTDNFQGHCGPKTLAVVKANKDFY